MCEVSVVFGHRKTEGSAFCYGADVLKDGSCWLWNTPATIPNSCSWSTLPQDVLVQILQHVPVQERFRHCGLVSKDWAAAAVESTTTVELSERCHHLPNLQHWLTQHGHRISLINITAHQDHEFSLLPCTGLRQLDLSEVMVQLSTAPGSIFPGILQDIPQLTRFTLRHASVVGGPDVLTGLTVLNDLQHLSLADLNTWQAGPSSSDWFPVPGELFSQLLKLTHLELDKCVSSSTLEHVSCLTDLKHLLLGRLLLHNTTAAAVAGPLEALPNLQWLCIEGLEAQISTSNMHGLGGLTKLTKLQLLNCTGFQPILLSGMLDLQELDLQGTPLLGTGEVLDVPAGAAGAAAVAAAAAAAAAAAHGAAGGGAAAPGAAAGAAGAGQPAAAPPGNAAPAPAPAPAAAADVDPAEAVQQAVSQAAAQAAAGAAVLLLELPRMKQLKRLSLVQVLWAVAAGQPTAAYAALTASSNLQQLDLSFSLMPSGGWQQVFNPGTQTLPALESINILCSQAHITDADLECMVQCCPRLRTLMIKGSLAHGAQLTALLDAKTLTSLSLNHVSSNEALEVLSWLRGLEELQMSVLSSIKASELLQLSALKSLTRLRVESSPETWIARYGLVLFENKAPAGAPPDVCGQLASWCLGHMGGVNMAGTAPQGADDEPRSRHKRRKEGWLLRLLTSCVS